MDSIEIYVATHKKQDLILPKHCKYIQVNAEKEGKWPGYVHDNDISDNISEKNDSYCELTALYTIWKNSDAGIKGLFHYRRFFSDKTQVNVWNEGHIKRRKKEIRGSIISEDKIIELLAGSDIILEFPFAPFPLSVFEDLQRFVYIDDIWVMIRAVERRFPEYTGSLWEILNSHSISYCNMFIAKDSFVDEYCTWLFNLLTEIEDKTNIDGYDKDHKRIYGYLAEVLLNVYVKHNKYKAGYVYRTDLLEENTNNIRRTAFVESLNHIVTKFGFYPIGNPRTRQIRRVRYHNYKHPSERELWIREDSLSGIAGQFQHYLRVCGWRKTRIFNFLDGYMVEAFSPFAKIIVIIVDTKEKIITILKSIEQERARTPFGSLVACRIYCREEFDSKSYDYLIRKGITVINRNV